MPRFKLLAGQFVYHGRRYRVGHVISSPLDLDKMFKNTFERLEDVGATVTSIVVKKAARIKHQAEQAAKIAAAQSLKGAGKTTPQPGEVGGATQFSGPPVEAPPRIIDVPLNSAQEALEMASEEIEAPSLDEAPVDEAGHAEQAPKKKAPAKKKSAVKKKAGEKGARKKKAPRKRDVTSHFSQAVDEDFKVFKVDDKYHVFDVDDLDKAIHDGGVAKNQVDEIIRNYLETA